MFKYFRTLYRKHRNHKLRWSDPINTSGMWYRCQYLVLNRTLMEAMPKEWQERLVSVLEEVGEEFKVESPDWPADTYMVKARDENGRFVPTPFGRYRSPDYELLNKLKR